MLYRASQCRAPVAAPSVSVFLAFGVAVLKDEPCALENFEVDAGGIAVREYRVAWRERVLVAERRKPLGQRLASTCRNLRSKSRGAALARRMFFFSVEDFSVWVQWAAPFKTLDCTLDTVDCTLRRLGLGVERGVLLTCPLVASRQAAKGVEVKQIPRRDAVALLSSPAT